MKKKLTAVLLTLCMVLGMLPMSAFAAWYKGTVKTDVPDTAKKGDVITVDSSQYYVYDVVEQDTLTYYTNADGSGEKGTLTWKADEIVTEKYAVTITQGAGTTLTVMNGETAVKSGDEVDANTQLTVTVAAAEGYNTPKVTVNGTEQTLDSNGSCTVTVTGATTIASSATADEPTAQEYTVTFKWNYEGAEPAAVEVTTVKGIAAAPAAPTRDGFELKGWASTEDAAEADVDLTRAFTQDATVYAVWTAAAKVEVPTEVKGTEEAPVVSVTDEAAAEAAEAITKANAEAEVISVNLAPTAPADAAKIEQADQAAIEVPAAIVDALETKLNDTDSSAVTATIEFPKGGVTVDKDTVAELKGGALTLTVTTKAEDQTAKEEAAGAEVAKVAESGKTATVDTVVSVDLKVGDKVIDSSSPLTKPITVSVKVDITIGAGAAPAVWWLPGGGKAPVAMSGVKYEGGLMSWEATHCSDYAFGQVVTDGSDTGDKKDLTVTAGTDSYTVTIPAGLDANSFLVWDVEIRDGVHAANWAQISGTSPISVGKPASAKGATAWIVTGQPVWSSNGTLTVANVTHWGEI